jgi:hypothetical protein
MRILLINGPNEHCGVYQYGKRLARAIGADMVDVHSKEDYTAAVSAAPYDAVLLNYHEALYPWWTPVEGVYYLYHENPFSFPVDPAYILNTDPTASTGIPRPLYIPTTLPSFAPGPVPVFGSFGFGFGSKYFDQIVQMVQSQYDTAIIRFVIPFAHHGDADGAKAKSVAAHCMSLVQKRGIRLQICHSFLTDEELVTFLASNDMNIFLYEPGSHRGCSSVLDFAIPAGRPIAISDSHMFRHVYSDAICAYRRPLRDILADGPRPLGAAWTPELLTNAVSARISTRT